MNALGFLDSLTEHLAVKVIANCIHMSVLLCAQKVSCATKLKVAHGNLKSASQICIFPDGRKPFFCSFLQHGVFPVHKKSISGSV